MTSRDQEALRDVHGVMDQPLDFPIADLDKLVQTEYLQDALIRCIEVLGEAVKLLGPELRDKNSDHPGGGWRG